MSDTKENEEGGQDVPVAVDESQQVQLPVSSTDVPVQEVSNLAENGKAELEGPAAGKTVEPEPEANPEGIPKQEVQSSLHSVPVEANVKFSISVKAESEPPSEVKAENHAVVENNIDNTETAAEVKSVPCEVPDSKICNDEPTSHDEPTTSPAVPADAREKIENREVENNVNEKQVATPADNGNSNTKYSCFLDPDHMYDGNESGTEEQQSAFMKEIENFFRERNMELKAPKFYGEGLNCLK